MKRSMYCMKNRFKRNPADQIRRLSTQVKANTKHLKLQPVIGVEIHAQIAAQSKLFSGADAKYGGPVNNQVGFLDAALPGTLPVLNRKCVEAGVQTALALNSQVNMVSYFDRKHYFYADLPAGYQITQQRKPLARKGKLSYVVDQETKEAGIWQIQLEQDSGKSLHDVEGGISLIDLNRAGVGLMEIVSAPDFHSSAEVVAFVKELQLILKILGTCDCKMDEGSFRVDASVSLHKPGDPLGTRCEVKNLNSVRFVKKAIDYEIQRQELVLESGGVVENETRSFDIETNSTIPMRDKEKVHDYRFMPEPNLLPLRLCDNTTAPTDSSIDGINVDKIRQSVPMLPSKRRKLLMEKYGLTPDHAVMIVNEEGMWEIFLELCQDRKRDVQFVTKVIVQDLFAGLNNIEQSLEKSCITVAQIADIIDLIYTNQLSRLIGRKLFTECLTSADIDVKQTVKLRGWTQITDPNIISTLCDQVIADNPHVAKQAKKGKERYLMRMLNKVQALTNECADPSLVKTMLNEKLSKLKNKIS